MRLLSTSDGGNLTLTEFEPDAVPPYAILSHTWLPQADEVTYEDVHKNSGKTKAGFKKLRFCSDQSRGDGVLYFWVDTCCIKRDDSSELSEAINSMFRWYQRAHRCYVYLSDVSIPSKSPKNTGGLLQWSPVRWSSAATVADDAPHLDVQSWLGAFQRSRYWTRGWTLQELLAPNRVNFYSKEGFFLGDKKSLQHHIAGITGIPTIALESLSLSAFSVVDRFHWAAKRETKKQEDHAYCLLGIFGVSMPLVYGEGRTMAEHRLKQAIAEAPGPDHTANDAHDIDDAEEFNVRQKLILESLRFPQMGARRDAIGNAHATTCDWFLTHDATISWNDPSNTDEHRGLLWINGKPGTGKSTIMKFALNHAEAQASRGDIVVSFFFNARGTELERTTVGLYRAIIYQLCDAADDLKRIVVDGMVDESLASDADLASLRWWTRNKLCLMLSTVVGKLKQRGLRCFIDALDECSEDEVREMIEYFELLLTRARETGNLVQVCFSSRHYPAIDVRYGQRLILEAEEGHASDMQKYVNARLRAGDSTKADQIKRCIREKSNGVFMWVVLVVEILNKEFLRGRIFAVEKRLDDIQAQLSELFKDMLRRDDENMDDLRLCLQWLLFAARPLRREEFYFAMVAGLDPKPETIFRWRPETLTTADMDKFILSCSKGLAERTSFVTVEFIHESVRDFLLKDNGFAELWSDLHDADALSDDRLKQCCLNYLLYLNAKDLRPLFDGSETKVVSSQDYPFIEYVTEHILRHAEEAASIVPQHKFLQEFPFSTWLAQARALAHSRSWDDSWSKNTPLVEVLASMNCPRLLDALPGRRPLIGWCGKAPLLLAAKNGYREVIRVLFGLADDQKGTEVVASIKCGPNAWRKGSTPLLWALEHSYWEIADIMIQSMRAGPSKTKNRLPLADLTDDNGCTALSSASEKGYGSMHDGLRNGLLGSRKGYDSVRDWFLGSRAQTDSRDNFGWTPLLHAADQGRSETARLLIDHFADVEARDLFSTTPLILAAVKDHCSTVQVLVDAGADVESADERGNTALMRSAEMGAHLALQLLLKLGARVDTVNDQEETALHKAAAANQVSVVETLLSKGAAINGTCRVLRVTALHLAARAGYLQLVKTLLDWGANVHLTCVLRKTALYEAAVHDRQDVVNLLLRYRAKIETADLSGQNKLYWVTEPHEPGVTEPPRRRLVAFATPSHVSRPRPMVRR